jgi:hypothetical protein
MNGGKIGGMELLPSRTGITSGTTLQIKIGGGGRNIRTTKQDKQK